MEERRFWGLLWRSAVAISGVPLGVFGVAVAFITWVVPKELTVGIGYVVIGASVLLGVIVVLFHAYYKAHAMIGGRLPRVRGVYYVDGETLVLIEPNPQFTVGMTVTVNHVDEDLDVRIALGSVHEVQENGMIQILVETLLQVESPLGDRQKAVPKEYTAKLRVRPSVRTGDLTRLDGAKASGRLQSRAEGDRL